VALSADLIDLDTSVPDDDLKLARSMLEHARAEGEAFDPVFATVVSFFAERELTDYTPRMERNQLVASLRDLRDVWRAAYEGEPDPEPPKPTSVKTVPLELVPIRRPEGTPREQPGGSLPERAGADRTET